MPILSSLQPAWLALANGRVFTGTSVGYQGSSQGEAVFNTAMSGYQEVLSDPSYAGQLVTLTCPHIGNIGTNANDQESRAAFLSGLIIRDLPTTHSNWRSDSSLTDYLQQHRIPAIANIDTRALTRLLSQQGSQPAALVAGPGGSAEQALALARSAPDMTGQDLAKTVSCQQGYAWNEACLNLDGSVQGTASLQGKHVVALNFGIKHMILRLLVRHGCRVTVVPAHSSAEEIMALQPDGVFLSNGPGDPAPCDYAIRCIQDLLQQRLPLFGICLGFQLLALACGARVVKMKFGHHGANHPVQDLGDGRVFITSQNHGFAVDENSLPDTMQATHRSLFDNSLQGAHCTDVPAFGFQGHPESSPGPHDLTVLFQHFVDLMHARSNAR